MRTAAFAAALILAASSSVAVAQINPFGSSRQARGLTPGDTKMLFDTTNALNRASPLRVGDARDWSNPDSGASGHVTVRRVFTSKGMTCHALRNTMRTKPGRAPASYDTNWCLTPGGEWKIAS